VRWRLSWRADPQGRVIADRHYNRQKIGADQFVPPGRCLVLTIPGEALWVTSWPFPEYVKHAWGGAWVNSLFRNERRDLHLSSDLIREAVAATRWSLVDGDWRFQKEPEAGMVTFIDESKTKRKRDPGRCYARAGFDQLHEYDVDSGRFVPIRTKSDDLLVFAMSTGDMPDPEPPLGANLSLFDEVRVVAP